jgi:hypothetical protein
MTAATARASAREVCSIRCSLPLCRLSEHCCTWSSRAGTVGRCGPQAAAVWRTGDTELALVLDCADPERAATFWCAALDYVRDGEPGGPYLGLVPQDGDGIELLLQRVPDVKGQKDRLHLDLRTK